MVKSDSPIVRWVDDTVSAHGFEDGTWQLEHSTGIQHLEPPYRKK
jgi:hypothetical protein